MRVEDIIVDCLTFPIATGQEETRRDGIETIEAIRELKRRTPTCRPRSASPTCPSASTRRRAWCSTRCSCTSASRPGSTPRSCTPSKIVPMARIPDEQREVALDLVYDRRRYDDEGNLVHDPLSHFLELFEGVDAADLAKARADELLGAAAVRAARAAHRRRRAQGARGRPRRGAADPAGARDRQRHPARGHEDRRRAVRLAARCSCRSCCRAPRS